MSEAKYEYWWDHSKSSGISIYFKDIQKLKIKESMFFYLSCPRLWIILIVLIWSIIWNITTQKRRFRLFIYFLNIFEINWDSTWFRIIVWKARKLMNSPCGGLQIFGENYSFYSIFLVYFIILLYLVVLLLRVYMMKTSRRQQSLTTITNPTRWGVLIRFSCELFFWFSFL